MQPPLYHPDYPAGFNYGAIGMIIGHEITHGFDDQGRHMGADGNMDNWWGDETSQNFKNRSQCMIDQYSQLRFADMNLNGQLTLGENIADNGGIKIAYQAWVRVKIFLVFLRARLYSSRADIFSEKPSFPYISNKLRRRTI